MNKGQLIEAVLADKNSGLTTKAAAEKAVNAVLGAIVKGLTGKDKRVSIPGFGTFTVVKRKARTGINPQTGEKIRIKASKTVKFSVGKALKAKL